MLRTDHLTCRWREGMVSCFVQNCFFGQHKNQNIYFFSRAKREIFFHILTLGYMTKTLKQIFFFSTKIRIFFFSNIGNQNIFLEKTTFNNISVISLRSYWWRKSEYPGFQLATLVVIDTDCTGSCKSNYNTIRTTTAPTLKVKKIVF